MHLRPGELTSPARQGLKGPAGSTVPPVMQVRFDRLSDDLVLLVVGKRCPTDPEWQAWLDFSDIGEQRNPRVIVYSEGGGPDAAQRRALAKAMRKYPRVKVAVLIDSVIGRGIVTALGWLYGNHAAFATGEVDRALVYLRLPAAAAVLVSPRIAALRARLSDSSPPSLATTSPRWVPRFARPSP